MKMKSLIVLAIASLVSVNSFAAEIVKGHLISHKEWTTGNAKAIFKTVKHATKHQFKIPNKGNSSQFLVSQAFTTVDPQTGVTGALTPVIGSHNVMLSNRTSTTQQYGYQLSVCVEASQDQQGECAYYFDQVELEPNGQVVTTTEPELEIVFKKAGNYVVSSSVFVGGNSSYYAGYQNSQASNTITITDAAHMKG